MRTLVAHDVAFILLAVRWTLLLSAFAFIGGGVVGSAVALARTSNVRFLRKASSAFIVFFQGTPLLMQLFLAFFGLAIFGFEVSASVAAAVALTLNTAAFLGEIWRGSIESLPKGQWEAARTLGLGYVTTMRRVIVPQAMHIALPPTIGFLVQLIKGTSLVSIIGFVELTRAGQIINNATFEPFKVFGIVAITYFVLCWPLSYWGARMEKGLAVSMGRPVAGM
jgi:polar amino acid transport system permease protein